MSLPSSPLSSALPVVEGAAAEVLEEIVQTRVDERVAEAVDVAQRQLRDEVKDEVDVRILENASTEHAKVEAERRRVVELERRLVEAERKAARADEADLRAAQSDRRRREAFERASVAEADLNAMRARTAHQPAAAAPVAPATVVRRFVAPTMTPVSTRRDVTQSSSVPDVDDVKRLTAELDAALAQIAAERNASVAHVTALQNALHEERVQAQVRAQLQSQHDTASSWSSPKSSMDKIPTPPAYTGLSGATELSFYDWKPAMEVYFLAKNWSTITDAAKCITYASNRLQKDAVRWFVEEYLPTAPVAATWEYFMTALADKFEQSSESVAARVKLHHLRQGPHSVSEYNADFRRLSSRIKDMSETDKQLAYQNGLRSSIRDKLIGNVETLDESMRKALKVEQAFSFARSTFRFRPHQGAPWQNRYATAATSHGNDAASSSSSSNSSNSNGGNAPMELGNVEANRASAPDEDGEEIAALQQFSRGQSRRALTAEQQRLYKENRCFGCHKTGHIRRDCPNGARNSKNE